MDLDADGRLDVISGSWPGDVYWFRRVADGGFDAAKVLRDRANDPLSFGNATTAFAYDWDGDADFDLIIGNGRGEVLLAVNRGTESEPQFDQPEPLFAAGAPIKLDAGEAAPVVADWDVDGLADLVVGDEEGRVTWHRNTGSTGRPLLAKGETILPASPLGWGNEDQRRPADWGVRVKPCVCDWNDDGRPDLLLGDVCGGYSAKPWQTNAEVQAEKDAEARLPGLRKAWAEAYKAMRTAQEALANVTDDAKKTGGKSLDEWRAEVARLKEEIAAAQTVMRKYEPQSQLHGFVWLFLRKPTADANERGG